MNTPRRTGTPEDDVGDLLATLLEESADPADQERTFLAVRAHWQRRLARRRALRRAVLAAAGVAGVALAAALLLVRSPHGDWGEVVFVRGTVTLGGRPAAAGDPVNGGLATTGDDGALVVAVDGASVRIGAASEVELAGPDRLRLDRGRVYVDRPTGAPGAWQVETPLGTVRELGTQFAVEVDDALTVAVREGAVVVEDGSLSERVEAGWALVRTADGDAERRPLAPDGAAWAWAEELAPRRVLDGLTVAEVTQWVARETGRTVRFADAGVERLARGSVVRSGSFAVAPGAALEVVLPTAGLEAVEEPPGVLLVRRP